MEYVIPTVGSSGYFKLQAPFNTIILENELYTCQAIRRISEYLANNEDIKTDIYDKYQIDEAIYKEHVEEDIFIISLQAQVGQWVYVPVSYILAFPEVNGIPYRTVGIGISLPAFPADKDFSALITDLQNLITDRLGTACIVRVTETSKTLLVTREKHDELTTERNVIIDGSVTDRSRYNKLLIDHQDVLAQNTALSDYIAANP
jgi:UDP-N-acetylglucosamine transferase subunit ALG13